MEIRNLLAYRQAKTSPGWFRRKERFEDAAAERRVDSGALVNDAND
jgi:hypothetical protein